MSLNPRHDQTLLSVSGLRKHFGSAIALDGVEFSLAPGEFLTLLGPSGSGKTTTLMSIAGFVDPNEGEILYRGRSIIRQPPEARGFGMVFQGYALFPHMTVEQNVCFPLSIRGVPKAQAVKKAHDALERVQLGTFARRLPRQLSGGQQQRVALARALVYEPEILLLDEPLSALDKKLRGDLQWELRQLNKESGASFLYVTHDQEEALSMSDRIAIFNHGRIVQIGTPTELYQSPSNLFVAGFLGRSNVLPATVQRTDADSVVVESEAGVMGVPRRAHQVRSVGEKVSVVIRPHQIRLASPGGPGLAARVEAISYGGNMMTYRLRTNQGTELYTECVVGEVNSEALQVGSQVSMQFDMKNVNVLEAMSAA